MNPEFYTVNGEIYSVNPPDWQFGFHVWSLMIPPVKPQTVLILGAAKGTVEALIKEKWGEDIVFTLIDTNPQDDKTIRADAREFVKSCTDHFDYCVVDLYPFEHTLEFAEDVSTMADTIAVDFTPKELDSATLYDKLMQRLSTKSIARYDDGNTVIFYKGV